MHAVRTPQAIRMGPHIPLPNIQTVATRVETQNHHRGALVGKTYYLR